MAGNLRISRIATVAFYGVAISLPMSHAQTYPAKPIRVIVAFAAGGLAGVMDALPPQRSVMTKARGHDDWAVTVDTLNGRFGQIFDTAFASAWSRWDVVYSYTQHSGPDRPLAAGYGWKARLFRPGRTVEDAFIWVRGSKTEAGVVRLIADAPDLDTAERLLKTTSGVVFG